MVCFYSNHIKSAIYISTDPVTITQALITPDIINEGDNVKITCQAQGRPQPNITWNTIQGPGLFDIITTFLYNPSSGVYITTSVLSLSNVSYYDIGLYECLASNNPYDTGAVLATDKHSFKVTVIGEEIHSIIKQVLSIREYSILCIWLISELHFLF